MKKWLLACGLYIGISTMVFGQTVGKVGDASIVPINYQGKAFINGEYRDLSYFDYKIYSKNNTVYLPLRLVGELLSTETESWEVVWDAGKPDEMILRCTYFQPINGGATSTGKTKSIQLTVGSKEARMDGEILSLSNAPTRMEGTVVLPIRSIGEIANKTVSFEDGLVILSDGEIDHQDESEIISLRTVKRQLENKITEEKEASNISYEAIAYINGECYYQSTDIDEKTDEYIVKICKRQLGKKDEVMKEIRVKGGYGWKYIAGKYYYIVEDQMYSYELSSNKTEKIGTIDNKWQEASWYNLISDAGKLYYIRHDGDWTMGHETLFEMVDGKAVELADAHCFGDVIFSGNKIYYMNDFGAMGAGNLYEYDKTTHKAEAIGSQKATYGAGHETNEYAESSWAMKGSFIYKDNLYTAAYDEEDGTLSGIVAVNLKDHTTKKVAELAKDFWQVDSRLYYIARDTGYLKVIDLDTMQSKVVIEKPISQAVIRKNVIYYSLQGKENGAGLGLYSYGFATGIMTEITDQPVKAFSAGKTGVVYEMSGVRAGLYRWDEKKNVPLESRMINTISWGDGCIGYELKGNSGFYILAY